MNNISLIFTAIGVVLTSFIWRAFVSIVWRPLSIRRRLRKQGVIGPDFKFYSGNLDEIRKLKMEASTIEVDIKSHDIAASLIPHYMDWTSKYGEVFLYWYGLQPRICITDMEVIKQILWDNTGLFEKIKLDPRLQGILGRGLFFTEGEEWDKRRKILSPAFTKNKLKAMTKKMAGCTVSMLDKWEDLLKHSATIEVTQQFMHTTADVLAHSIFGSNNIECMEIFSAQRELLEDYMATALSLQIPSYIPTKKNLRNRKLHKKMKDEIEHMVQKRLSLKRSSYGDDLLDLLLESANRQTGLTLSTDELLAECKSFFFGGQETTSQLLTWTMFLLSTNQDWQEKLRQEVLQECGMDAPTQDNVRHFNMMHLVILEVLRLYSPVILLGRENSQEIKLGGITIPKKMTLVIPVVMVHRKKELWGEDAYEFNPMRFENGEVKAAKYLNALISFGDGPRVCIGKHFSVLETKIVIAMILQRFTFTLSPDYKHIPIDKISLQPLFGLPIVFSSTKTTGFE